MPLLLTSKTRSKLLAFFFAHADEHYYVRELASLIEEDAGNLSRELRRLADEGVLLSALKGRIKFYRLNKDYALYSDLKSIFFKTEGAEGALRRIVQAHKEIETAFIYGSFAKGSENKISDIDLLMVGRLDRDKLTRELRAIESKLNREVNFNSYTMKEFDRERRRAGSFLNIVLKSDIIVLKGSIDGK